MFKKTFSFAFLIIICSSTILAQQNQQMNMSQQFRMGDRLIRIAEPGELVDSVNVWGDIGSSGRYLVPKGTTLPILISYALGPRTLRGTQTELDWSKMRVEVNIQEFVEESASLHITKFEYRFEEPFPEGFREFNVENNQTVTIRVKRKPSFRDYLSIFASTVSAVAATVILLDRLNN
jgi:hypothetical protein